jgi:hypothetical protein
MPIQRRVAYPLLLMIGMFLVQCANPLTGPTRQSQDIFSRVSGTWDWAEAENVCADNPHTISFTENRDLMLLTTREPLELPDGKMESAFRYQILEHGPSHIRSALEGETRQTDTGELVIWDLILRPDGQAYCWHRTDWPDGACTREIMRCD